jgi:flagellar basal-body rod protein FlgB
MLNNENTLTILGKMMELTTSRQKVIANNLANANTPGYKRQELEFQNELKRFIEEGDMKTLSKYKGDVTIDSTGPTRNDGNNVSGATEMNNMSQNGILFNLMQRALSTKVGIIKSAITP